MTKPSMDASELRAFSVELEGTAAQAAPAVRGVIRKGAVKIKDQLQREMRASRHFKGVTRAIDFDTIAERDAYVAEIGPRKGPGSPGNLANIAYFGTSRGGGTVPDPQGALDAETPHVERELAEALRGLL